MGGDQLLDKEQQVKGMDGQSQQPPGGMQPHHYPDHRQGYQEDLQLLPDMDELIVADAPVTGLQHQDEEKQRKAGRKAEREDLDQAAMDEEHKPRFWWQYRGFEGLGVGRSRRNLMRINRAIEYNPYTAETFAT